MPSNLCGGGQTFTDKLLQTNCADNAGIIWDRRPGRLGSKPKKGRLQNENAAAASAKSLEVNNKIGFQRSNPASFEERFLCIVFGMAICSSPFQKHVAEILTGSHVKLNKNPDYLLYKLPAMKEKISTVKLK